MNSTFQKSLSISKTDTYTYTIPKEWLGDETITNHSVTVDNKVVKNNSSVTNNVIGVSLTGDALGDSKVVFDFTTSGGRSDCITLTVKVIAAC